MVFDSVVVLAVATSQGIYSANDFEVTTHAELRRRVHLLDHEVVVTTLSLPAKPLAEAKIKIESWTPSPSMEARGEWLPDDYETCDECKYDHAYEPQEAAHVHAKLAKEH